MVLTGPKLATPVPCRVEFRAMAYKVTHIVSMGASVETEVEIVERRVCRGEFIIAEQRFRIEQLSQCGLPTRDAEDLLRLFLELQRQHLAHRDRLIGKGWSQVTIAAKKHNNCCLPITGENVFPQPGLAVKKWKSGADSCVWLSKPFVFVRLC
ncbi:hypothetical protein RGCCGE502_16280 [Rhizobium grahamii CCGE 502]|uniref:Uncharacterized protein n=2 Tax=Rhizobium grahamii TaxID=1120045 RepID=S3HEB0_9HYPH|nr:hypothetical protein RGCCGE502_16280 [Rhizobium grahamii CCGE 502]